MKKFKNKPGRDLIKPLKVREKETFYVWGHQISKWKDCPECGSRLTCEFDRYVYKMRCSKCQVKKDKLEGKVEEKDSGYHVYVNLQKEVTAFGFDTKTGEPMYLDKKGKKVRYDDPGVRYDPIRDPHGWKASGQKVAPRDDRGRPNY